MATVSTPHTFIQNHFFHVGFDGLFKNILYIFRSTIKVCGKCVSVCMYYTLNIAIPYIYIYFEIQTRKKKKKKTLTKPVLNFSALCVRARYRSQLLKLLNVCVNWWLVLSASLHDSLSVSPSFTSRYTTRYIYRCDASACAHNLFVRTLVVFACNRSIGRLWHELIKYTEKW